MGWAIPEQTQRQLKEIQKLFLSKLFNDGLRSRNKITAEKAEKRMGKEFVHKDYLSVTTIKTCFSRGAAKKKKEKSMKKMKIQMKMRKVTVKLRVKMKHLINRRRKAGRRKKSIKSKNWFGC